MERAKAQLELDWEGRLRAVEGEQYQKHQDIIATLTTARDQVRTVLRRLKYTYSVTIDSAILVHVSAQYWQM